MAGSNRHVITLGALVDDDPPVISLGGIEFDGKQTTWPRAARFEAAAPNPARQVDMLAQLLRERANDPDAVTDAWLDQHLTRDVVGDLVAILFRGEDPTITQAPQRRARKGNG